MPELNWKTRPFEFSAQDIIAASERMLEETRVRVRSAADDLEAQECSWCGFRISISEDGGTVYVCPHLWDGMKAATIVPMPDNDARKAVYDLYGMRIVVNE